VGVVEHEDAVRHALRRLRVEAEVRLVEAAGALLVTDGKGEMHRDAQPTPSASHVLDGHVGGVREP
jgi:hypothetical protein